jgi:hypothetical protein
VPAPGPSPAEPRPVATDAAAGSQVALTGPTDIYPMVDSRAPVNPPATPQSPRSGPLSAPPLSAPPPAPPPAPPAFPAPQSLAPPAFPAPPTFPAPPMFPAPPAPPRPVASAPVQRAGNPPWVDLGTLDARDALQPERPRRGGTLLAVLAASVAVLLVAAVVIVVLNHKPPKQNVANPQPSTTQTMKITTDGAPTNVRLVDKQTSITLTWSDPSGGVVPLAVLGARANDQPQLIKLLDPGTTTYTQEGVNDSYDHCYVIAAFYRANGSEVAARSGLICTHRN